MPLIPHVGRKTLHHRAILAAIYLALIGGGLTMVLPFLFTLSRASANRATVDRLELFPRYLVNRDALFTCYVAERYGDDTSASFPSWAALYGFTEPGANNWADFSLVMPPLESREDLERARRIFEDTNDFVLQAAADPELTLFVQVNVTFLPRATELARRFLRRTHPEKSDHQLSRYYNLEPREFESLLPGVVLQETFQGRSVLPDAHPRVADLRAFKKFLALEGGRDLAGAFVVHFLDLQFQNHLRTHFGSFAEIRKNWPTKAEGLRAIRLPPTPPAEPGPRAVWFDFVRKGAPLQFVRLRGDFQEAYREFARRDAAARGRPVSPDKEAAAPAQAPRDNEEARATWARFLESEALEDWIGLVTPATAYAEFLRGRHGEIGEVNRLYGTNFASWEEVRLPLEIYDAFFVKNHLGQLRWRLFIQNYETMFRFLVTRQNAGINTVVLIFCTLVASFIVNPLAAYALSRFRLPYTNKILLFLLAVMAFPSEVQMIPDFLLIKHAGLLNTYGALILPGLASGMSIFLLKGFFDSLPQELYESAQIDGAGEIRMFLKITIPLSTPIMAYLAFGVFVSAYSSWNWALLRCQDPALWTIAVELFQFQMADLRPAQLKYASFVIASIPTLVAFLLCQRIILRGIVVPQMK